MKYKKFLSDYKQCNNNIVPDIKNKIFTATTKKDIKFKFNRYYRTASLTACVLVFLATVIFFQGFFINKENIPGNYDLSSYNTGISNNENSEDHIDESNTISEINTSISNATSQANDTESTITSQPNGDESETTSQGQSSAPDVSECYFKNIDELLDWVNGKIEAPVDFPEYNTELNVVRELIKEQGLLYPVINGKPVELNNERGENVSPILVSTTDSKKSSSVDFFTTVTQCPFIMIYPNGEVKDSVGDGLTAYFNKKNKVWGTPIMTMDNYKELDEHAISFDITPISIIDADTGEAYITDARFLKEDFNGTERTWIVFIYKGTVIQLLDYTGFLESEDFKSLGFIDLLKDDSSN